MTRPDRDDEPVRPARGDEPVLPARGEDETGVGWGEATEPDDDDERLRRDRPPHWDQ